ncbi:triose-phosphate isomerase [Sorangium sp. So ce887]|uniref:triose-phosphate isomerase n=1 Tax=Sorangium sp. So ce887 TaxID=3133324 RepID=UPI003F64652E
MNDGGTPEATGVAPRAASRRPLIAGNWKMNAGGQDACPLAAAVAKATRELNRAEVVIAPPFTAIAAVAHELAEARSEIGIAAQNMSAEVSGAFTGEIASGMLKDAGATWVILGHSERRQLFAETDESVARKVASAIAAELRPIVCVGETLEQREAGETLAVVERQVRAFLDELAKQPGFGVIAYEPVWAIGTGKVARAEDAQEVHAFIRGLLAKASEDLAFVTRILYGGSVKADNADALLAQDDIDGALVGGASLDAAGFAKIVDAAHRLAERAEQG